MTTDFSKEILKTVCCHCREYESSNFPIVISNDIVQLCFVLFVVAAIVRFIIGAR